MSTTTTAPAPSVSDEPGVGRPDFLDARRGWAPVTRRCGPGSCAVEVWASVDGGATWERRSAAPVDLGGPPGPGFQPTVHFATDRIGWLYDVPEAPDPNPPGRLYRTGDGGRTWTAAPVDDGVVAALVTHGREGWRLDRHCPGASGPCAYRVLRSTDAGAHWAASAQPEPAGWVEGFAAPTGQVAYVLSNAFDFRNGYNDRAPAPPVLARSGDGGRSWARLRAPCTGAAGEELTTSPVATDLWFVCHDQPASMSMEGKHLYRSSDGGGHWSAATDVSAGAGGEIMAGSPSRACLSGHDGVGCTGDGGRHWFFPSSTEPYAGSGGLLAVEFLDGRHAWIIGDDPHGGGRFDVLLRTADGGGTWRSSVIGPRPPDGRPRGAGGS